MITDGEVTWWKILELIYLYGTGAEQFAREELVALRSSPDFEPARAAAAELAGLRADWYRAQIDRLRSRNDTCGLERILGEIEQVQIELSALAECRPRDT
jgi:hypothetical protein